MARGVPSTWCQAAARASALDGARIPTCGNRLGYTGLSHQPSGFKIRLYFPAATGRVLHRGMYQVPSAQQALLWCLPAAPGTAGAPKALPDLAPQKGWYREASHPKSMWEAVCKKRGHWPRQWLHCSLTQQVLPGPKGYAPYGTARVVCTDIRTLLLETCRWSRHAACCRWWVLQVTIQTCPPSCRLSHFSQRCAGPAPFTAPFTPRWRKELFLPVAEITAFLDLCFHFCFFNHFPEEGKKKITQLHLC